jgi:hypothetical protein
VRLDDLRVPEGRSAVFRIVVVAAASFAIGVIVAHHFHRSPGAAHQMARAISVGEAQSRTAPTEDAEDGDLVGDEAAAGAPPPLAVVVTATVTPRVYRLGIRCSESDQVRPVLSPIFLASYGALRNCLPLVGL